MDGAGKTMEALYTEARAAQERGDLEAGAAAYRQLAASFRHKKGILPIAAEGLRACGKWMEAVALLNAELEKNPISPALLLGLADAYVSIKNFGRAAEYIERHLARDPNDVAAQIKVAAIHVSQANWAKAEAAYAQVMRVEPLNIGAILGHGDALFNLGKTDEAVAAYRRAATVAPDNGAALFKLGSALMQLRQSEEAEQILRRAITREPDNTGAWVNLGTTLYHMGRLDEAEGAARKAVASDANSGVAHFTLGQVLLEKGGVAAAAEYLRTAASLSPASVEILLAVAAVEASLGNTFAAEGALQKILPLEPTNIEARHLLAALHGEAVPSPPKGYTEQLFDWFAGRFDQHLVRTLRYRTPQDVTLLLQQVRGDNVVFNRWLDLGCGTGLVAEALAGHFIFTERVGLDASRKMLAVAEGKRVYDRLLHGDAAEILPSLGFAFDLITAIDMFIYVGDLSRLMPLIAAKLSPGGLFVYSLETLEQGRYKLQVTGRFAHAVNYVEELGRAAGLEPVVSTSVILRNEQGKPVKGALAALRRT